MNSVRWTDNVCTVGGTCIHGCFNATDLRLLFELCPTGTFTPTFFEPRLPVYGYGREGIDIIKGIGTRHGSLGDEERGYYFTFMESEGQALLTYLREHYPLRRGA